MMCKHRISVKGLYLGMDFEHKKKREACNKNFLVRKIGLGNVYYGHLE